MVRGGLSFIMAGKKLVIGTGKEKDNNENEIILRDNNVRAPKSTPTTRQEPEQEQLDENVWGNDHTFLNKLDEGILADRRLYVRVIYIQSIKCNVIKESKESQPILLTQPIEFMIVDLSIGGIGIICEHEIKIGTILIFKLTFDNITYEVKYEVVYCFPNDDKFRAGLRMAEKDKEFIRHLKILVARLSLQSKYGNRTDNTPKDL